MTIPVLDTVFHNLSANIIQDVRVYPDGLRTYLVEVNKAVLRSKNAYALATSVHMDTELNLSNRGLAALASDATQTEVNARANILQAVAVVHAANVGTSTVDGAHKVAETTVSATLAAIPVASNLATSITLINGLLVWLNAHAAVSGKHFHDDATAAAATITTSPPTTIAHCRTDLNDLMTLFQAHFDRAAP